MLHSRRIHSLATFLVLALLIAACSSGGNGDGNGAECPGSGGTATVADGDVSICSVDLEFDATTIEAPAGEEFTITYTNAESQPHNVALYVEDGGEEIVIGEVITGPDATTSIVVPALDPGTYYFQCDVHPEMNGTVVVGAASLP